MGDPLRLLDLSALGWPLDLLLVVERLYGVRGPVGTGPRLHLEGTIHVLVVIGAVVPVHIASLCPLKDWVIQILLAPESKLLRHVS